MRARLNICRTIAEGLAMVDNIRGAHFQARHLLMALRAGEPSHVSLALSLEAGYVATSGGPGRARARYLTGRAMEIAQETVNVHALGRATFARGLGFYLVGEWRRASEECARAVSLFRDRCVGVTWDLTSAQRFEIGALQYLGALREIGERVPVLLEDARRRGDLYLATELHSRDQHLVWLALDNPGTARRNIEAAMDRWSRSHFHLQHYNAMLALAHCELYTADAERAWDRLARAWPELESSLLMRVQVLRVEAWYLRARCALSLFSRQPDAALLDRAAADARRIEKERMDWSRPLALVVRAGLASARGDADATAAFLRDAAADFDRAEMALHAACVRYGLSGLLGGDEGRQARRAAEEWVRSEGVARPSAVASLFVPLPPPAGV